MAQTTKYRIHIDVNSGAQQLVVCGSAFNRATDETDLMHAIDDFFKISHGLVDSLMQNTTSAPTTVLSIKPVDDSLSTPFKLVLPAHDAFTEAGPFIVNCQHPHGPIKAEHHDTYQHACKRFWIMMKAMVNFIAGCQSYQVRKDATPTENVVFFDTPMGVRLASLTVQM